MGFIEEIDSDEVLPARNVDLSQDDMTLGKYLNSEIRDVLRTEGNVLANDDMVPIPPMRKRSIRKQKEGYRGVRMDVMPTSQAKKGIHNKDSSE